MMLFCVSGADAATSLSRYSPVGTPGPRSCWVSSWLMSSEVGNGIMLSSFSSSMLFSFHYPSRFFGPVTFHLALRHFPLIFRVFRRPLVRHFRRGGFPVIGISGRSAFVTGDLALVLRFFGGFGCALFVVVGEPAHDFLLRLRREVGVNLCQSAD